jgi:hypothetical protein
MFLSLWRSLRGGPAGPHNGGRRPPFRPVLEPLEDRWLPTVAGVLSPASIPSAGTPTASTNTMRVTVYQDARPTVLDLGPVFAAFPGLQHADGLRLTMLGNTNSGLVKASLSKTQLTLCYTPGKTGTATLTVGATDADGVSVRETLLVTVLPLLKTAAPGV